MGSRRGPLPGGRGGREAPRKTLGLGVDVQSIRKFAGPSAQGVFRSCINWFVGVFFLIIPCARGAPGAKVGQTCFPNLPPTSPRSVSGPKKGLLGPISGHLGTILGYLGPLWGQLGAILDHLGVKMPSQQPKYQFSVGFLMNLGPILTPSWGLLGPSWGHLGAILGPSWGHLGAILKPS